MLGIAISVLTIIGTLAAALIHYGQILTNLEVQQKQLDQLREEHRALKDDFEGFKTTLVAREAAECGRLEGTFDAGPLQCSTPPE
jgi:hypothetical protein